MRGHELSLKINKIIIWMMLAVVLTVAPASALVIEGVEQSVITHSMKINHATYVPLIAVCDAHGIVWEWDSVARTVSLKKNGKTARIQVGSRYIFSGERVDNLEKPVEMKEGAVLVPLSFTEETVREIFEPAVFKKIMPKAVTRVSKKERKKEYSARAASASAVHRIETIVVDPGHGGKDPGAIGKSRIYEKTVVLDVAKRLKKRLVAGGIDVILTRDSDEFIPLPQRAAIANRAKADFFISIHANASRSRKLNGVEVYYLSEATDDSARALAIAKNNSIEFKNSKGKKFTSILNAILWDIRLHVNRIESIELAKNICSAISRETGAKNRGARSARFYVLKGAQMPAVLVEMGYISNNREEEKLRTDSYREKVAKAIAKAVFSYKDEYEKTNGFTK